MSNDGYRCNFCHSMIYPVAAGPQGHVCPRIPRSEFSEYPWITREQALGLPALPPDEPVLPAQLEIVYQPNESDTVEVAKVAEPVAEPKSEIETP